LFVYYIVAARSSNGSGQQSGAQLLTAQDERLGFEAAVAALGQSQLALIVM